MNTFQMVPQLAVFSLNVISTAQLSSAHSHPTLPVLQASAVTEKAAGGQFVAVPSQAKARWGIACVSILHALTERTVL